MCQTSPQTTPFGAVAIVVMFLRNKIKKHYAIVEVDSVADEISQITM